MKPLMLTILLSLAAPLCATSISYSDEPRAAIGALCDRLRVRYQKNEGKLDSQWLNGELANRSELEGSYCDASNYGFCIETSSPPVVLIVYRKRLDFQPRDFYIRSQLSTGKSELIYGKFVGDRVIYPWPPDLDADARRLREHWLLTHFQLFVHVWWIVSSAWLALSMVWLARNKDRNCRFSSLAFWSALVAFIAGSIEYTLILFDWSIGPKGVLWWALGMMTILAALPTLFLNRVKTRAQLSLAMATTTLVLPPIATGFVAAFYSNCELTTFLSSLVGSLMIVFLLLVARHRWATS